MFMNRFKLDGKKVLIAGGCGLVGNICIETVMELEGDPITLDIDPAAHYSYDLANRYVVSNLPAKIGPVDVVINCQVGNQKPVTNPATTSRTILPRD